MKNNSIIKNTFVYTIRILSSMLFPIITFPYISRVLSPDGVGKYNFSTSVISYFSLLAGLGISTYAIREGAKVRDNRQKLEKIAQELFTINIISAITSYVLFLVVSNIIPKFREDRSLLLILSLTLPLSMFGTEWIFSIYEDYFYITIRSVSFQFVSLILMLLFVKNQGAIMLGFLKENYDVGIYVAATKIYNIVRSLLIAFITVVTPRLSYYYGKRNENSDYDTLFNRALNMYMAIIIPAAIGVILISNQSLQLLSGKDYLLATNALKLLAIALVFSTSGSFIANTVLIVTGQEKKIFVATVIGAIVNLSLNFIFIPLYSYTGAAMTTLIAEFVVFNIQLYFAKTIVKPQSYMSTFIKPIIACIPMIFISNILSLLRLNYLIELFLIIIIAVISYFGVLSILRHEIVNTALGFIKKSICTIHKGQKMNT